MNFNEEVARELKAAGLTGFKLVEIPDEKKPTAKDYAELEKRIAIRTRENDEMLALSIMYARESMPCGN